MAKFRWGIFGTGAISAKFIAGLAAAREAQAVFVASRTRARAEQFAALMHVPRAIGGYAEAARAGGANAIYIATPPSEHVAHALLCIDAGIPVLVEKPFAFDGAGANQIAEAARQRRVFAMEAMWTRFLPASLALKAALAEGSIGDVRLVSGNFGISHLPDGAGMFSPVMGGGAVSHLGAYPLSLGQWLFGPAARVQAMGTVGPSGVDEDAAFQIHYTGGVIGSFFVSLRAWAPDTFTIMGDCGMIATQSSIVRPHGLTRSQEAPRPAETGQSNWRTRLRQHGLMHALAQHAGRSSRKSGRHHPHHYRGNGYHYEADEVAACIGRGAAESTIMPLNDSIAVATTADTIRRAIHDHVSTGNRAA